MLRWLVAVWLLSVSVAAPVAAEPGDASEVCPPVCNSIPASAWLAPTSIPLYDVYRWPSLPDIDLSALPRFRFEEICASPTYSGDPRSYSVHSRAVVETGRGQWQLHVQVVHWRGDTLTGGSTARAVVEAASGAARMCRVAQPATSLEVTVDEPDRLALVMDGSVQLRQFLVAHPASSTISELALWAATPTSVSWAAPSDSEVFDRMTEPLCTAYVSSCG